MDRGSLSPPICCRETARRSDDGVEWQNGADAFRAMEYTRRRFSPALGRYSYQTAIAEDLDIVLKNGKALREEAKSLADRPVCHCNGGRTVVTSNSHEKPSELTAGAAGPEARTKGDSAMTVLLYNNHYISVLLTPNKSGDSAYNAVVEIRNKRENQPAARLIIGEAFASAADASTRGVEMGKKWIDERQ